jgi:hypothetical protein
MTRPSTASRRREAFAARAPISTHTLVSLPFRRCTRGLSAWLVAAGLAMVAAPAGAQPLPGAGLGGTASDEADTLFRKGNDLYKQEKWTEAEQAYRAAWDLKKTHDIASNLGHTEMKLGQYRDAAEHYDFALRHHPPTAGAEKKREYVQKGLTEAMKQVGTVRVHVDPPGAEVFVDGKLVGTSPLEADVYVDPGRHAFTAKVPGRADAQQTVDAVKGSVQDCALVLGPQTGPAPAAAATKPGAMKPAGAPGTPAVRGGDSDAGPNVGLVIAGSVLAVGGLVAGAAFTAVANGKSGDAAALRDKLGGTNSACYGATAGDCTTLSDTLGKAKTFTQLAATGFVVGGAAAALTLTYALWPRSASSGNRTGVRAVPWMGPQGGGFVVSGDL